LKIRTDKFYSNGSIATLQSAAIESAASKSQWTYSSIFKIYSDIL